MVGAHIFSAAPFANPNGKGQAGAWKEVFILIRGPRPSQIAEAKSTVVTETDALIDEGNQEVGTIYPNPVDKILNITLSPNDELYMIRIINTSGQIVFSKSVSARTGLPIEIDTTGIGLKAGVYYVQLVDLKGHCFTRKIVKA